MKSTSKQEFEWKTLGDSSYLYNIKTGKVFGSVYPHHLSVEGALFSASYEGNLGEYINELYAKAAVLEAATLATTRKILNKGAGSK